MGVLGGARGGPMRGERRRGEADTRDGARARVGGAGGGSARRASVAELCSVRGVWGAGECTRAEAERCGGLEDGARRASGEETGLYTLTVTVPGAFWHGDCAQSGGVSPSLPLTPFLCRLLGFYTYTLARRETGDGRPGFDPRARAFLCATQRAETRRIPRATSRGVSALLLDAHPSFIRPSFLYTPPSLYPGIARPRVSTGVPRPGPGLGTTSRVSGFGFGGLTSASATLGLALYAPSPQPMWNAFGVGVYVLWFRFRFIFRCVAPAFPLWVLGVLGFVSGSFHYSTLGLALYAPVPARSPCGTRFTLAFTARRFPCLGCFGVPLRFIYGLCFVLWAFTFTYGVRLLRTRGRGRGHFCFTAFSCFCLLGVSFWRLPFGIPFH